MWDIGGRNGKRKDCDCRFVNYSESLRESKKSVLISNSPLSSKREKKGCHPENDIPTCFRASNWNLGVWGGNARHLALSSRHHMTGDETFLKKELTE